MGNNGARTEFPKQLRRLREQKRVSRRMLAELCGMSKNMVSLYESGEVEPTVNVLVKLSDYFQVSVGCLLGLEKNF